LALEAAWPVERDRHSFDALLDAIDQADKCVVRSEMVPVPPARKAG